MKEEFGYVKNSFELINNLNGMTLKSNYKLVSFDITSMYTHSHRVSQKALEKDGDTYHKKQAFQKKNFLILFP